MIENKNVRQIENENHRRWFSDEYFDLILWEDKNGSILKFELCYGKSANEHVLTWAQPANHLHLKVDDGEGRSGRYKMTPVFLADGYFDKEAIAAKFIKASTTIDQKVATFIHSKIVDYKGNKG